MKWIANIKTPKPLSFVIEQETLHNITENKEEITYILYVYDTSGFCTHDYMQDTLESAKYAALELFHVPMGAWKEVE